MDLIRINAEIGWKCNFRCEDCYRFFECPSPHKQKLYQGRRVKAIGQNLSKIKHIIAVMSGKGGVGKSIVSANLAVALAKAGYAVSLLDSDLCGPSIPSILGVEGERLKIGQEGIIPPTGPLGIKIVSNAFLQVEGDPVTWLSDLKRGAQELFLADVDYGELDFLIVDMPPGTGSEAVNLLKYLPRLTGAILITLPSAVVDQAVSRGISLCRKANVKIIGLIENMSGYVCPGCGNRSLLQYASGEILSREAGVPLLGKIARDPLVVSAADRGRSFLLEYPQSGVAKQFFTIASRVEEKVGSRPKKVQEKSPPKPEKNRPLDLIEINFGYSCEGEICHNCNRYFQCDSPKKKDDRSVQRSRASIERAMSGIRHKIAVMSCKGGVGKSTFSANLAAALAQKGRATTILDCDFHGPSIPKIFGVEGKGLKIGKKGIVPVLGQCDVGVVSVAFVVERNEAVTWFDALKKSTIEQFLNCVDYGSLDYLIIDLPPGTGAESYGLLQYTPDLDGVVIVNLPSENPQAVSRRSIELCRQAKVPVIGIVENMSHFLCPECRTVSKLSGTKSVKDFAYQNEVTFLGDIPLDDGILESCEEGVPYVIGHPSSEAAQSLMGIVDKIEEAVGPDAKGTMQGTAHHP